MYKQNVNLNILEDNSKNKNKDNLKDSQLTASWPEWGRQYNTGMREKEENKKKKRKGILRQNQRFLHDSSSS